MDWSVENILFISVMLWIQNFNKREARPITYGKKLNYPMLTKRVVVDIIYFFYVPAI